MHTIALGLLILARFLARQHLGRQLRILRASISGHHTLRDRMAISSLRAALTLHKIGCLIGGIAVLLVL